MAKVKGISFVKLQKTYVAFISEMDSAAMAIRPYCEFDCSVGHQPSDGFVLEMTDTIKLAPLEKCVEIIQEKGFLSTEDYLRECI